MNLSRIYLRRSDNVAVSEADQVVPKKFFNRYMLLVILLGVQR